MRLKKVKGALEETIKSPFYVDNETVKNNITDLFNINNLEIEIGTGKGDFIIGKAKQNPEINYIGIEKYESVLVRAVQKIENIELPNLRLMLLDAEEISDIFKGSVDTLYLNFSDPWPKKRHEKRRLTSKEFLKKYDTIFKNKKHIVMKTDNRHLFEYSLISFVSYGYKIADISLDLYNDDYKDNIATEYERKFHEKGNPIYMVEVTM